MKQTIWTLVLLALLGLGVSACEREGADQAPAGSAGGGATPPSQEPAPPATPPGQSQQPGGAGESGSGGSR